MKTQHKSLFHFYKYAKGNKISIAGVLSVVEAFEVFDRDKPTKKIRSSKQVHISLQTVVVHKRQAQQFHSIALRKRYTSKMYGGSTGVTQQCPPF